MENRQAFVYSEYLLRQSPTPRVQEPPLAGARGEYVRDQAFRRAVNVAYDRRRGLCGIKIVTLDGRTAVDAAHLKPWSLSHDDRPANGMGLCHLCHWAFDAGMLGLRRDYEVLTSPEIASAGNIAAHLGDVERAADRRAWGGAALAGCGGDRVASAECFAFGAGAATFFGLPVGGYRNGWLLGLKRAC